MSRPRNIAIIIAWNLHEIVATHMFAPGENEWKIAEALLDQYPEASHVRFYGDVNGLTRTERWDEVRRIEEAQA